MSQSIRALLYCFAWTAMALLLSCARHSSVELRVDFSHHSVWEYRLSIAVEGRIQAKSGVQSRGAALDGTLRGTPVADDPSALMAHIPDPELKGDLLSDAERVHMTRVVSAEKFSVSLRDGSIAFPDSILPSSTPAGDWDFYRALGKALPALPEARVRPGFAWERERHLPVVTKYGIGVGHAYQTFILDSVSVTAQRDSLAHISWNFTYKIEPPDSDSVFREVPLEGRGLGSAVISISRDCVYSAHMEFEIRPSADHTNKTFWKESVSLELIQ